jgi:hypothetical protein
VVVGVIPCVIHPPDRYQTFDLFPWGHEVSTGRNLVQGKSLARRQFGMLSPSLSTTIGRKSA